jgi:predicted alpha/beta superfamily hydrolase
MAGTVTIECRGAVPAGYAPFVCGPFVELGGGRPRHAPTLVCAEDGVWRLAVQLRGSGPALDHSAWLTGLRALSRDAFKIGAGFRAAPPELSWSVGYAAEPDPTIDIFYYSGWPQVRVLLLPGAGGDAQTISMRPAGPGRAPGETLWAARIPSEGLGADWGFELSGPASQVDRPPPGSARLYRPRGTTVYLLDGEIFGAPPPERRSAPRVETLRFLAPELQHSFVIHVALPRDYDTRPDARFPLLLLHDGQNQLTNQGMLGGWHSEATAARLAREGRMADAVLAAVEAHPDRERTLLPHGDRRAPQGQAATFAELLAGPIAEMLRSRYRLARGPEHSAIVGAALGASHALLTALQRPDSIGLVGCISYGELSPERNLQRIEALGRAPLRRIYLDSGTRRQEADSEEQSDDNALGAHRLRELLLRRGLVLERDLRYRLAYGDAHGELAWRRRVADCFEFLLPP